MGMQSSRKSKATDEPARARNPIEPLEPRRLISASLLKDIYAGGNPSNPWGFVPAGSTTLFAAEDASFGREPWITNGTTAGTVRLTDLEPTSGSSMWNEFASLNGVAYFFASQSGNGYELFRSDGTGAGTVRV